MRFSKCFLVCIILFNSSCTKNEKSQTQLNPLSFSHAIEIAKQYLIKSGHSEMTRLEVLEEPDNTSWNEYSSPFPKLLEDYGLKGKKYFAICFLEHVRDGGAIVFVDKDEKKVIGTLFGTQFEKNTSPNVWIDLE